MSTPTVVSSTSSSVDILVKVNKQLGCNLSIIVTITNGNVMERRPFETTTVTFMGLSPGDYTCNISIVDQNDVVVESVEISCDPNTSELLPYLCYFCLILLPHRFYYW